MATAAYPKIPESNWWKLRDQFKKTLPNVVTPAYLKSLLGLKSDGAAQNLIGPLRQVGLIDEAQRPTGRANDWRNDAKYAEVWSQSSQRSIRRNCMISTVVLVWIVTRSKRGSWIMPRLGKPRPPETLSSMFS